MKLDDFLQMLTEGREIGEINEKLKGKVDANVIDTLSSLMKKGKYDNIAMAIFNALQEWDDDYDKKKDFLRKRTKLVYRALKEAGRDNPNFSPENDLMLFKYDSEDPMRYWSVYRSGEKQYKEKLSRDKAEQKAEDKRTKENFGLDNVRIKELDDAYLIFPKNWKMELYGGIKMSHLQKQWESLRHLSNQMAKRDTSGRQGADANHWCVASDNENYYKSDTYKGGHKGGIFIVVVLKDEDGKPDWNKRYLFWCTGPWVDEIDNYDIPAEYEFADKFNHHLDIDEVLSQKSVKFLKNVMKGLKTPKGDAQYKELSDRAEKAIETYDYNKNYDKKVNRDSPLVKNWWKVLRYLRNKYRETNRPGIREIIADAFKQPPLSDQVRTVYKKDGYKIRITNHRSSYGDRHYLSITRGDDKPYSDVDLVLTKPQFDSIIKNPDKWYNYISKRDLNQVDWLDGSKSFTAKTNVLNDTEPPKGVKDALLNNKVALGIYSSKRFEKFMNDDEIKEFFVGPNFMVTVRGPENMISYNPKPWDYSEEGSTVIGHLDEPDIFDRVKRTYERELEGKR